MAVVPGLVLGLDLGTSNTVAVLRWPDGRDRPLLFDGSPVLPSAVFAGDTGLVTGRDAERSARIRPDAYEPNPKRRIDEGSVVLGGRELAVVDLIGAVLARVWGEANRVAGGAPAGLVLTHPAAWGAPRREVLVRAAARAGMPMPLLVPEPVAAAAYFVGPAGARVPVGACIVVYDFGAGTFDASVVRRDPAGFTVLASEGLPDTGGLDVDAAIVGYLGAIAVTRDPAAWRRLEQPGTDADRRARRLLWDDVRAAKETLSRATSTYIHVPLLEDSLPLGREQLDRLAGPVLDRTVTATRLAIRAAGLTEAQVAGVFLVGGSSRIPLAATLLHRGLGRVPTAVEQPETVVAEGSLYARPVPAAPAPPPPAPPPPPPPAPPFPAPRPRRGRLIAVLAPVAVAVLAAAVLLVVQPWHGGTPQVPGTSPSPSRHPVSVSYAAADNTGPARQPDGARTGGTLTLLLDDTVTHLDPARVYYSEDWAIGQLVFRTLTAVRTNADGTGTLIGDLATDPGQDVHQDCRTWRFTLRAGLKYADGSAVTSHDVGYAIARSFRSDLPDGATTLQKWLTGDAAYNKAYAGPASGPLPPGVSTPDDATIVLTFPKPHCDLPYAASLPNTAPVPVNGTDSGYDKQPPATGPYRITSNDGKAIVLERNPYWRAADDPLRTAGPDVLHVSENVDSAGIPNQVSGDPDTLSWSNASATPGARSISGPIGYTMFLNINTRRVTDVNVRRAIAYAIDKRALIDAGAGAPASTIIPPSLAGYLPYPDPYPYRTAKATSLLAGRSVSLTLATSTSTTRVKQAESIREMLTAAGFSVTVKQVGDAGPFYDAIAKPDNPYDLYIAAYEPDWPTGYSLLSLMFDGRTVDSGSNFDLSLIDDPGVNATLDQIGGRKGDPDTAAGELDRRIMTDLAPVVPLYYPAGTYLRGAKVGGSLLSNSFGLPSLTTVYLTQ